MKKWITACAMVLLVGLSLVLAGCGDSIFESMAVKDGTLGTQYEVNSSIDYDSIVVVVTYESGKTVEITAADLEFSKESVDLTTVGTCTLTITWNDGEKDHSIDVTITVVETTGGGDDDEEEEEQVQCIIGNLTLPDAFSDFNEANTDGEAYYVGSDNAFIFQPTVYATYISNSEGTVHTTLSEYTSYAWVSMYVLDVDTNEKTATSLDAATAEGSTETIYSLNGTPYLTVDNATQKFYFSEDAEGETFILTVTHEDCAEGIESGTISASNYSCTFEVEVMSGWNVYEVYDIAAMDNYNEEWDEIKETYSIPSDVDAIIFHSDIAITKEDLPSSYFYTDEEMASCGSDSEKYTTLEAAGIDGSMKDYTKIFRRVVGQDETFTIQGNLFTLDVSTLPYVTESSDQNSGAATGYKPGDIDSHVSLFFIAGYNASEENYNLVNGAACNIENLSVFGNASKEGTGESGIVSTVKAGGIIFCKTANLEATIEDTNIVSCYIGYFADYYDYSGEIYYNSYATSYAAAWANQETTFDNVTIYDSYNCSLFAWAAGDVYITNGSSFTNSGGPAIIASHEYQEGSGGETAEDGVWTNIYVTDSTVQAYVSGTECWFTQQSLETFASGVKALSAIFQGYSLGAKSLTFYKDGDTENSYINAKCVFKQGSGALSGSLEIQGLYVEDGVVILDMSGKYGQTDVDSEFTALGAIAKAAGSPMFAVNDVAQDGTSTLYHGMYNGQTGSSAALINSSYTSLTAATGIYASTSENISIYYPISTNAGYLGIVLEYFNVSTATE